MSLIFAIAAQTISLPDGTILDLRVNQADSSQVEIHVKGRDDGGTPGTHIMTFKRNGGPLTTEFRATQTPDSPADFKRGPIDRAGDYARPADPNYYPSVDKDATRTAPNYETDSLNADRSMDTKTSPVHGKINTAGADNNPVKPREGKNEDTPVSEKRDRAGVGLKSDI